MIKPVSMLTISLSLGFLIFTLGGSPAPAQEAKPGALFFTDSQGRPLESVIKQVFFTGSVRIRPEYHSNELDFDDRIDDNYDFVSTRYRLGLGAELVSDTTLYIEVQNNSFWGDDKTYGPNTDNIGEDNVKIYQGYGEVRKIAASDFSAKIGRQELVYGTEMLLGNDDFGQGISHDAFLVDFARGPLSFDAWWAKEVEADRPTPTDKDVNFWGIYGRWLPQKGSGLDSYWLFVNADRTDVAQRDKRQTVGVRGYHRISGMLSLNGEFAYQFGQTGLSGLTDGVVRAIRAYAVDANFGVSLKDYFPSLSPAVEIGYSLATGDGDPYNNTVTTFNPLYGDVHPRLGYADLVTLSNIKACWFKGTISPGKPYEIGVAYYGIWIDKRHDLISPANFRPGYVDSSSDFLGQEGDVFVSFKYTDHLSGQVAWARLFSGCYIRPRFQSKHDSDRVYLHLVFAF